MENRRGLSFKALLKEGERRLKGAGIEEARIDNWCLFEYYTGFNKTSYFLREEEEAGEEVVNNYFKGLERRCERLPVSYIIESRGFMGMDFYVNKNVLIPRQDTEILVEEVLKRSQDKTILDLCTGSGCIAISIMAYGKPKVVVATDISGGALEVAKKNLSLLSEEKRKRLILRKGDLFERIHEKFDIIVSNPPYIEKDVIDGLAPEVSCFEPRIALDGSKDGLLFYQRIAKEAPNYLKEGGKIFLEIGKNQTIQVKELLCKEGFENIQVIPDLAGFDRVVVADWFGKMDREV